MTGADVAELTAEIRRLREELSAMSNVMGVFYDAGRADALNVRLPARPPKPHRDSGHLRPVPG